MKKISLITLITLMVTMISFQGMAQEVKSETVIIRTLEIWKKSSKMVVTSPDGTTKSIELSNVDGVSFEGNESNSVIIQSEINKWKSKGFSIDGLTSQSNYAGAMITTIILSK